MASYLPSTAQAFSAFLTPVIALAVAYIAYRQYDTARAKLALDLFDKRLAVYEQLRSAIRIINGSGRVSDDADRLLLEAINASEFLFGDDIRKYLDGMWSLFSRLRVAQSQLSSSHGPTRKAAADAQSRLLNEITEFYYGGGDVFAHYMRMDQSLRRPLKPWQIRRRPE